MINNLKLLLGSGLYTGYFPFTPGTIGSLLALTIYLIFDVDSILIKIVFIIIMLLIGIPLGNFFESKYGKDPKQFTLDEFVGTWITFLVIPLKIIPIIVGFLVWRALDILKPFPANKLESLRGGLGIMIDDVVSGMYSLVIMIIFNFIFF